MAVFGSIQELKNAINESIYANDAGLLTAEILQERLHDIIDTLNALAGSGEGDISALESANALAQIYAGANKVATEAWVGEQGFISAAEKGATGGVAELDEAGKVPAEQLPEVSLGDASSLTTTHFSISEVGGELVVKYGTTVIAKITSAGFLKTLNDSGGFETI
jgi:hypothetical protein